MKNNNIIGYITEQELSDELLTKINNKEQELPSDIKSQLAEMATLKDKNTNVKYKLVVINGEPFLEVVGV